MFDSDVSDRSEDESVVLSIKQPALKSGHYIITTNDGTPLGCERREEITTSLVVTLPNAESAPTWHIQRRESGLYTVNFDNAPIYFEQMALRAARRAEDGFEWVIEPSACKNGLYRFRNATVGAYSGFEEVWTAPKYREEEERATLQVRIGDLDGAQEEEIYFRILPA